MSSDRGLSEELRMMRQSCRDFVDDVVLPFIKKNWKHEWSMVPEDRLPPQHPGRGREDRHPHARRAGRISAASSWRRAPRSRPSRWSPRRSRAAIPGLADKMVQNWKVSVLLRQFAPKHLQEKWFKRLVAEPQFLMAHCLTEPRGASDRWLPYNVPEAAMQTQRRQDRRRLGDQRPQAIHLQRL